MPTNHQGHTPQSEENKVIHAWRSEAPFISIELVF